MAIIRRLVLKNFKRFKNLELEFDPELNILVGGNEAGKSSVLQAIDIALNASRSKVESLGLETLFNMECISEFLKGERKIVELPELLIEVYLDGIEGHHELDGRNNSKSIDHLGIKLVCKPVDKYTQEIQTILAERHDNFPFEYYSIRFLTFTDETILPYKKPLQHLLIDSSQINSEYATREYTRTMYTTHASVVERNHHSFEYRKAKSEFKRVVFKTMNDALDIYKFDVRTSPKASVETDIIITEGDIPIDSKGKGRQCFIKTEFALRNREHVLDILLLEEPENHLSHVHMHKLIDRIRGSVKKQLFIATHSSLIATRLNLKKVLILSEENLSQPTSLKDLSQSTANFFMKAPDNNVLELALCKKAILVEGDAEFILMDALYKNCTGGASTDTDGIYVISVDGTSFKRYLELAKLLGIKVAAIRDNDGDYKSNCVTNYADLISDSVQIFADADDARYTFEVCIYQDNTTICEGQFAAGRKKLTVEEYMLKNKTEAAFELLEQKGTELVAPNYIQQAITWIRE
ncbi:AAA family ATPase [Photorhabdus laumondii subsp. laumondii]|uniref:Photorhabdus luminescens subsp. laumondii TTO1 complete genome segment 2/17 n=2 Tax=Photorhabdus laumondii subsp. laumondii TaxID=141679 RepID=Q7N8W7_PHOLL|nr:MULTISPECIES: AAA family ATPase [Photorhabdus]AWK40552.1 ATP-dependent endonuclease [Photorhabdus laumondii subsp. laumondii]AXG41359.1 ATP-dependent endonuclease [Photorhabdus laumondii subsp. laumondii]AXG45890.1 ATP-dependent endonuclease [Photorhabdus laumondii subsp. laumondii]KTL63362.1 ATP-dependent endonuclease [Photorhabdus laumondii subsp. laumondii]MCZ1251070.1 ATP-dependent endonuclease [Photorhabdus laumondii subsp. laumondii]